jgi:hypothetical protein
MIHGLSTPAVNLGHWRWHAVALAVVGVLALGIGTALAHRWSTIAFRTGRKAFASSFAGYHWIHIYAFSTEVVALLLRNALAFAPRIEGLTLEIVGLALEIVAAALSLPFVVLALVQLSSPLLQELPSPLLPPQELLSPPLPQSPIRCLFGSLSICPLSE